MIEYLHLAVLDDGERFEFTSTDTLTHPLDFLGHIASVREAHRQTAETHALNCTEVYGCVGPSDEVASFEDDVLEEAYGLRISTSRQIAHKSPEHVEIKTVCTNILRAQRSKHSDFKIGICHREDPNVPLAMFLLMDGAAYPSKEYCQIAIEQFADAWLHQEEPFLLHKQLMTNGFMICGVKGKRIIAPYFNAQSHEWELLLEGARRLRLQESPFYIGEQVDSSIIGSWTEPDIETIILNPIYGFGISFEPYDVIEDWLKALLYYCSISFFEKKWDEATLKAVYSGFLEILKARFPYMKAEPIVDEEVFLKSFRETARRYADSLRGVEESELTRRFASEMPSRAYQLKALEPLLERYGAFKNPVLRKEAPFDYAKFGKLLDACTSGSAAQKGHALEDATAYMLESLSVWRLAGRRVRTDDCEIDLCYVNQSLNQKAWDLGCMMLVECKNRIEQTGISVLRNLVFVMDAKGAKTGMIVSTSGFTKVVRDQVRRLATQDKILFLVDGSCLRRIANGTHPNAALSEQYASLMHLIENDYGLLC